MPGTSEAGPREARVTDDGLKERAERVRWALVDPARLGLQRLRQEGANWKALCVWHAEKTSSLGLRLVSGQLRAKCFGCGRSGSVLDVLAAIEGVGTTGRDFARVVEAGEHRAAIGAGRERSGISGSGRPTPALQPEDAALRRTVQDRILELLLDLAPMAADADACGYLVGRGFRLEEIPADWCALPPAGRQRPIVDALVSAIGWTGWGSSGLAAHPRGADAAFSHPDARLLIPWRAPGVQGSTLYAQRRRLDDEHPKYVGAARLSAAWPFGVEDLELVGDASAIVWCEGALDALALRVLSRVEGLDWLPFGLPGLPGWQAKWAALGAGRRNIVAVDADPAGDRAVQGLSRDLYGAGALDVSRMTPKHGKDWCDTLAALRRSRADTR